MTAQKNNPKLNKTVIASSSTARAKQSKSWIATPSSSSRARNDGLLKDSTTHPKRLFVLAGEASGDLIGSRLLNALKNQANEPIEFVGIGGHSMIAAGLQPLFPMHELSVMGFVEVIKHLPRLLKRLKEVKNYILETKPDAIVTIDLPDFSFRLAKQLRSSGIPHIHYIAPTVWAWRPGRAKKISKLIDHLLCVLPFEPPYFEKHGLKSTFVGHMVTELGIEDIPREKFRLDQAIAKETPLLCLLPGSRQSEIEHLLPTLIDTVNKLAQLYPHLQIVVPLTENVNAVVRQYLKDLSTPIIYTASQTEKYEAMRASDVALAASGTVNLELAMAQVPFVIAYKMNTITGWLAPKIIKVKYMTMTNIILDKPAVPEYFQNDCTADKLFMALSRFLTDKKARDVLIKEEIKATSQLYPPSKTSSEMAAEVILHYF